MKDADSGFPDALSMGMSGGRDKGTPLEEGGRTQGRLSCGSPAPGFGAAQWAGTNCIRSERTPTSAKPKLPQL